MIGFFRAATFALGIATAGAATASDVAAAIAASNVAALIDEAIDSPDGKAGGIVQGSISDRFKASTGSNDPVLVEITTLKKFRQDSCRRLNLRFSQTNVPAGNGRHVNFGIDLGFNVCRGGLPPDGDSEL